MSEKSLFKQTDLEKEKEHYNKMEVEENGKVSF